MSPTLHWLARHFHLLVSAAIVLPVGLIYGIAPTTLLPQHLDIPVITIDQSNMLRAIMCLYLGISTMWLMGMWKPRYWKPATQLCILFMWTLAAGRLLSMILDGLPSGGFLFGVTAELILGGYALWRLRMAAE